MRRCCCFETLDKDTEQSGDSLSEPISPKINHRWSWWLATATTQQTYHKHISSSRNYPSSFLVFFLSTSLPFMLHPTTQTHCATIPFMNEGSLRTQVNPTKPQHPATCLKPGSKHDNHYTYGWVSVTLDVLVAYSPRFIGVKVCVSAHPGSWEVGMS